MGEAADPTGLYPNGSAQLWPILYGVVAPTDPKAMSAWSHFNEVFPRWYVNVDDNYAWTSIARVAELMGDNSHARMALTVKGQRDFLLGGHEISIAADT